MGLAEAEIPESVVEAVIWEVDAVLRQRARYPSWINDHEFEQLCRDAVRLGSGRPRGRPMIIAGATVLTVNADNEVLKPGWVRLLRRRDRRGLARPAVA